MQVFFIVKKGGICLGDIRYRKNNFSRNMANESKMGAYYTDLSHAKSIGEMLIFPEDDEVCCLEPSIGDGEAVLEVVKHGNVKVFGVELNNTVAQQTEKKQGITACLRADFLSGVVIKHNAFSLCFGNPPYLDDEIGMEIRERCEKSFLEKVTASYLKKGGVLIWIVSEKTLALLSRYLLGHYEVRALYRFREKEYAKWKQTVFVGIKKETTACSKDEIGAFMERCKEMEELPEHPSEQIIVPASNPDEVNPFATKEFDADAAYGLLDDTEEARLQMSDYDELVSQIVTQKTFGASKVGMPPIPLKKDSLFLLAAAGVGQGIVGTAGEDMHLQRGVVRVVEDVRALDTNGNTDAVSVTQRSQVVMHLVETSGKITELS